MSHKGKSGGDKRAQYFNAIKNQKLDTIRWSLTKGGIELRQRDEDSLTAIMIASATNKTRALEQLLYYLARNDKDTVNLQDDEGRTALMYAAKNGHLDCIRLLVEKHAQVNMKDESGRTARSMAQKAGHKHVVDWFDHGDPESSEGEEEEEEGDGEETSTQRNKRKKKELQEKEARGKAEKKEVVEDAEAKEIAEKVSQITFDEKAKPTWPEVEKVLAQNFRDVTLLKDEADVVPSHVVDPALWLCNSLITLKLQVPQGSLDCLPPQVGRLIHLEKLILSHNGFKSLPEEIGLLVNLKFFELENNQVTALPASMAKCVKLEALNLAGNQLTSLEPLSTQTNLVTVMVDRNKLTSLEPLPIDKLERLHTLSASHNEITDLPEDIGSLQMLQSINMSDNKITEIIPQFGQLKEKKLQAMSFDNNPISDKKVVRLLEKGRQPIKDLLTHLRKQKPAKKGKKKGKKQQAESEEESGEESS
eukprot:GFYU01000993.1.p1 GENE.GFYU01000993.1~~GFYU01000993.1.p1  ORF type:complete len:490 (-),score=186.76 GFYU01000993.1:184-1611(-)